VRSGGEQERDALLGTRHVSFDITKGNLRLDHPEFGKVACGV
jgi:hypothetical protein